MIGRTVREKSANKSVLWTVIEDIPSADFIETRGNDKPIGFKNIGTLKQLPKHIILASLFLELMFKNKEAIKQSVQRMNYYISAERSNKVKPFTPEEFIICIGLLIGACEFEKQGKKCWMAVDRGKPNEEENFHSLIQHPNFDRFMPYNRFKDFRRFLPTIWIDDER